MRAAAGGGYSTATDLADWLVRSLGMPFREAHHVTGRIVAAAEAKGLPLDKLPLAAMQAVEPAHHGGGFLGSFRARTRSRAAPAMGERRHRTCAKWREPG